MKETWVFEKIQADENGFADIITYYIKYSLPGTPEDEESSFGLISLSDNPNIPRIHINNLDESILIKTIKEYLGETYEYNKYMIQRSLEFRRRVNDLEEVHFDFVEKPEIPDPDSNVMKVEKEYARRIYDAKTMLDGIEYQSREGDITTLLQLIQTHDEDENIQWITADNKIVELTHMDAKRLARAMRDTLSKLRMSARKLKDKKKLPKDITADKYW